VRTAVPIRRAPTGAWNAPLISTVSNSKKCGGVPYQIRLAFTAAGSQNPSNRDLLNAESLMGQALFFHLASTPARTPWKALGVGGVAVAHNLSELAFTVFFERSPLRGVIQYH